jgi:DNA sulfur modification protein DndD
MIDFRLIKIEIFNFACYYGKNTLNFNEKSKENIFLFKLPNGYGKTSLFHAIKWGFYGEEIEYFKDSDKVEVKDFLNDRLDKSKDLCYVEINFEYGRDAYILKRIFKPSSKKNSSFSLNKNGREFPDVDDAQEELNQIIPKNFADFFMFDGEQLSKFMTAQKEFNFKDSIHQLLGLKQIRILRDDLLKLQNRYDNKLTQQKTTNAEVESKKRIISGILSEMQNKQLKIDNSKKVIEDNDQTKDGLEEHRLRYENLPKVMDDLKKIRDKQETLTREMTSKENVLENNSENIFIKFIERDISQFIDINNQRINELKELCGLTDTQANTQSSKRSILENSIPICNVCGHKLDKEEKRRLEEEQKRIKDSLVIFERNSDERNSLKDENNLFSSFLLKSKNIDFQKELDELQEKREKYGDLDKKRKELELESQKEEYGSLAKINREINILVEENTTKKDQINILQQQIKGLINKKEEITKEIVRLGHDDKITDKIISLSSYTAKLVRQLEEALELGTLSKRKKILEKSNELFKEITNKPEEYGGIEFENDDSYAFVIKTNDNKIVTNPSKGEKQVLAMSFLLGLNQYTGRNNVILMDTPVASLDDIHSAGIGKALSKLNNQVIFLAQPQELGGQIYENMKKSIVKEFTVKREDYKSSFNEEEI